MMMYLQGKRCGGFQTAGLLAADNAVVLPANLNGGIVPAGAPCKRLTAAEAMARTKERYNRTIAYLD